MKAEEQRIAIAELCGIKCKSCNNTGIMRKFGKKEYAAMRSSQERWVKDWPEKEPDIKCDHSGFGVPDYLNDLNAMHEAEELLIRSLGADTQYVKTLTEIASNQNTHYTPFRAAVTATYKRS